MRGIRTLIKFYPKTKSGLVILTNSEDGYGKIEKQLITLLD